MQVSDAVFGALATVVTVAFGLLPIADELKHDWRAWRRRRRAPTVVHVFNPRCPECVRPLPLVEPFTAGVAQLVRCTGCGVNLQARRDPGEKLWAIATVAELKGQRTATLPAVGPLRRAARAVAQFLQPRAGVEPGESSLPGPEA